MAHMTIEQFTEFAQTLPEGANKRGIAKELGLMLPIDMQLEDASVDAESNTVAIPPLMLEDGSKIGRRTIDTRVARQVAKRILDLCNQNNL